MKRLQILSTKPPPVRNSVSKRNLILIQLIKSELSPPLFPASNGQPLTDFWGWILISGLAVLLLINVLHIGGVIWSVDLITRIWTYVHMFLLIVLVHMVVVELLVRKLYLSCLVNLVLGLWVLLNLIVVGKWIVFRETSKVQSDMSLLPNEGE